MILSVETSASASPPTVASVQAVDGVSFELAEGEILAIVGESGSGKSVTAQTLLGLTRAPNTTITGSVRFDGRDLTDLDDDGLRGVRGERIAMIFQDPMTSLNPVYRVGDQIDRDDPGAPRRVQARGTRTAPSSCCDRSASPIPNGACTITRTSSPAACGNA